jgi:hypothetical protein
MPEFGTLRLAWDKSFGALREQAFRVPQSDEERIETQGSGEQKSLHFFAPMGEQKVVLLHRLYALREHDSSKGYCRVVGSVT